MKLSQLASKPQLITIEVNDDAVVQEFGEPLEFHTWDRQPLDIFMKLASATQTDPGQMIDIVRKLILDENGKEIISKEQMLPTHVLVKVIARIVETLGK